MLPMVTWAVQIPEELQLYKNDLDLSQLKYQLFILPDVIRVTNQKVQNDVLITKVKNVRTI